MIAAFHRDRLADGMQSTPVDEFLSGLAGTLEAMQQGMFDQAASHRDENVVTEVKTLDEMQAYFEKEQGFVRAKWCEDAATEETLKEFGVTIRCLPYDQSGTEGACVITGKPATTDAIFGKSY